MVPKSDKTTSGKHARKLVQFAVDGSPVPLFGWVLRVGLAIFEIREETSAIEQKLHEIQEGVSYLKGVTGDNVTAQIDDRSKEAVVKATTTDIEGVIEVLFSALKMIGEELVKVCEQNEFLTGLNTAPNTNVVECCLNLPYAALEKFKLLNNVRDSALLQSLHYRLGKIHGLTRQLAKKVDDVYADLRNMKQILAKTWRVRTRAATLLPSDRVVRQQMPLKPAIFYGRDAVVEKIVRLLMQEETSRICILGPGGMGKTSVSLVVVESPLLQTRFPSGNRFWVPCVEAMSAALFLKILSTQLGLPGENQDLLENIISELRSKKPCLILLDNFETPWNVDGGNQKKVEDILRRLATLNHVAILVTMRGLYPPCDNAIKWQSINIQPLDDEACLQIVHKINPRSKDDPDVGRLLSALGNMPYVVTLMAKLGRKSHATSKELLNAWFECGPDILDAQDLNRSISLSLESNLVKGNSDANVTLLAILSLLPAGTTKQNLRWWAPTFKTSMILTSIAALSSSALLVEQQECASPVFFVLPVVRSYMQQHNRITKKIWEQVQSSCCQYVLDNACRYDDSTFSVKSKALAAEDANIQSILFNSPTVQQTVPSERTVEALIAFSWHRCDTKPDLDIVNQAMMRVNAFRVEKYIVLARWCLGRTYFQLGDYLQSYNHLQEACQLFNTFPPGDLELQRLGGQIGIDFVDTCIALQDKNAVPLARDVEMKCAAVSDDLLHGRSLVFLGAALGAAQQWQEALRALDKAKAKLVPVGNSPNLAIAWQTIAHVHYHMKRLPEALEAIEEAWKHAELSDSPFIQAIISREFSTILFSANKDTLAWKHIEIALMKASHVGDRFTMASALEYTGYGYLRKGDYQEAYGVYEAAAQKYLGTIEGAHVETCKDNMARIKQKQGNPDTAVGFQRPGFDFDKSLFYPCAVSPDLAERP